MTKAEKKAYDKMIDQAADKICGGFFNAALSITDDIYLALLYKIKDRTNAMIINAEKRCDRNHQEL